MTEIPPPPDSPPENPPESPANPRANSPANSRSESAHAALSLRGLTKLYSGRPAADNVWLDVPAGSFYGLVGPNGAGKTTTLSMATGLLRPDGGRAHVLGRDVWADPVGAKRLLGILPDGVRLFDRLTGAQLITYAGLLRGMTPDVVASRCDDLLRALGLEEARGKLVADYSAGMTKKVALASALIHAPRVLVLDEPFEAVDPVSATNIRQILTGFVASGGTVVLSSHVMDLVQKMCDHVAIVIDGVIRAAGTVDDVRGAGTLEERFVSMAGGGSDVGGGLQWLRTSSD